MFPPTIYKGSSVSLSLPTFIFCSWIIVILMGLYISHCDFDLYFPNDSDVDSFLLCVLTTFISLEKYLFKSSKSI